MFSQVNIGQLLLCEVKGNNDRSAEDLDEVDCIRLESMRTDGAGRAAHRNILRIGSKILAENIDQLRKSEEQRRLNRLCINMSIEMMDIILEYLYTREPINVTPAKAIELYAAAERFGLIEVTKQVEEFCRSNLQSSLLSKDFWNTSNYAGDVELFIKVLEKVPLDTVDKFTVMQRAQQWSADDAAKTEIALKINKKLLSQSPTNTAEQPTPDLRQIELFIKVLEKLPVDIVDTFTVMQRAQEWSADDAAKIKTALKIYEKLLSPSSPNASDYEDEYDDREDRFDSYDSYDSFLEHNRWSEEEEY